MPCGVTRAASSGLFSASMAPAFSASPRKASISAWLSMIPVDGE
jgi:hypothetical protein